MFCQYDLTPCLDLVWFYINNSESNISPCYYGSLDLETGNVPAPFELL